MKIRNLIAGIFAMLQIPASAQTTDVTITGKINPSHNGEKVTIIYGTSLSKIKIDSARVKDGTIIFNLTNVMPQVANLSMGNKRPNDHISIYIEKQYFFFH